MLWSYLGVILMVQWNWIKSQKNEIQWWKSNIMTSFKEINISLPSIYICTDASLSGWGCCYCDMNTGGQWTPEESKACRPPNRIGNDADAFDASERTRHDVQYAHQFRRLRIGIWCLFNYLSPLYRISKILTNRTILSTIEKVNFNRHERYS